MKKRKVRHHRMPNGKLVPPLQRKRICLKCGKEVRKKKCPYCGGATAIKVIVKKEAKKHETP